jgi:hypothetical protein
MHDLITKLGLEFEPQFSIKKAVSIFAAAAFLLVGISLAMKPTMLQQTFGAACFILVVRIIMGSPVEYVLTQESMAKFNAWLDNDKENPS